MRIHLEKRERARERKRERENTVRKQSPHTNVCRREAGWLARLWQSNYISETCRTGRNWESSGFDFTLASANWLEITHIPFERCLSDGEKSSLSVPLSKLSAVRCRDGCQPGVPGSIRRIYWGDLQWNEPNTVSKNFWVFFFFLLTHPEDQLHLCSDQPAADDSSTHRSSIFSMLCKKQKKKMLTLHNKNNYE